MNDNTAHRVPSVCGRIPSHDRDRARGLLVKVQLATGGSALLCGGLLVVRPDGSLLGLPTRVLVGGPFADWRVPGSLLAGFVGVGLLAAGSSERRGYPHSRGLSMVAGSGLIAFEAVEVRWLGFNPLQAVFMVIGAGVVAFAVAAGNPPVDLKPRGQRRGGHDRSA